MARVCKFGGVRLMMDGKKKRYCRPAPYSARRSKKMEGCQVNKKVGGGRCNRDVRKFVEKRIARMMAKKGKVPASMIQE